MTDERFAAAVRAGDHLSNIAFNLAQTKGHVLNERDCKTMDESRRAWDAARAEVIAMWEAKVRELEIAQRAYGESLREEVRAVASDLRHVLVEMSMGRWTLEVRDWLPPVIGRLERAMWEKP